MAEISLRSNWADSQYCHDKAFIEEWETFLLYIFKALDKDFVINNKKIPQHIYRKTVWVLNSKFGIFFYYFISYLLSGQFIRHPKKGNSNKLMEIFLKFSLWNIMINWKDV